ncbi:GTPase Era [Enterobacteriaceae endosymbiont of Plateumaris consimilis]|uniref:GTPase Era n=1 Tax=Enterobacteriaceae endosymbiont of Plateumaris consimilis TaxID=2675794 RepID=UPI001448CC78|nr:GTPase Era [Enterobacteriaceae endosymbiont of Plateumaris consimilis]QJC28581.1 GTPase Era [Enterobacteriaceae endosymbiont of Plateumaris consimilis]
MNKIISFYFGRVLMLGRTNSGKSTLLNQLIGKKISITSHKINTTCFNISGIYNHKNYQIEYIDTPGLIENNNIIYNSLFSKNNFDAILLVLDQNKWNYIEEKIIKIINNIIIFIPIIIVINKIDKIYNKTILLSHINFIKKKIFFTDVVMISAKKKLYINDINHIIFKILPNKKHVFPKNYITNQSKKLIISEIIREYIIRYIHNELPYKLKIKIESFIENPKTLSKNINVLFYVKKLSQKKILIGKNANMIKFIINRSQNSIEKFFNKKVTLKIWIKLK